MSIPLTQIPDLINHSLAHFKERGKFETYFDLQEYVACDYFFAEDKYSVQSGNQIEWRVVPDPGNGSFRFVHENQVTDRPTRNIMQKCVAPWCLAECKAVYLARLMTMMRDEAELYNYLNGCYFDGMQDGLDGLERSFLAVPDNSSDTLNPMGLFFWLNFCNTGVTDTTGNFNGQTAIYGDATTTTSIGGLSTQTYPKHRNWAFTHTGMNMTTIDSMRLAMLKTNFKPPRNIKQYYQTKSPRFALYMSIDNVAEYERLVNAGPDDRNGDLNPFRSEGILTFRKAEVIQFPLLDGHSLNPIIGLDRNNFRPVVHSSWWFAETEPMNDQDNPHTYTVQWNFQFNFIMENKRRGCWVGHTAF